MSDNEFFGGRRRRRGNGGDAFSPYTLFANGEQGVWYDPSDLTPEKVSWRRNLLTYSQDFENAAWTKSNASILSNLALYSQDFDNASWTARSNVTITANSSVAPDGTTTAETSTENAVTASHVSAGRTNTFTANAFTLSVYAKQSVGTRNVGVRMWDGTTSYGYVFNISSGTTVGNTTGDTTPSGFSITSVGNGWYRLTITQTMLAGAGDYSFVMCNGQAFNYAGDNTSAVLLWGAQLVPGSTAQTYTRSLATAAPIQFADPLGGTLADKLVENTATNQHFLSQNAPVFSAGAPYTTTLYAKAAERFAFQLYGYVGAFVYYVNVNLSAKTLTGAFNCTPSLTELSDGWFRVTVPFVPTASGTGYTQLYMQAVGGGSPSYTGDGVSGIYVYGAQVEQASTASAYQRITDFSSDFLAAFPTHALYQESTGVTPVTALGQSVGLVIDKRLGGYANLGANQFANPDFSSGTTGWLWFNANTPVVENGWARITATTSNPQLYQNFNAPALNGRTYEFRGSFRNKASAGTARILILNASTGFSTVAVATSTASSGTLRVVASIPSTGNMQVLFDVSGATAGDTIEWNSAVLREVPGNHALQATSAARPTLQARSNLLVRTEDFADAAWTTKVNPVYGVTDPNGGTAAVRVTSSATNQIVLRQTNFQIVSGGNYTNRIAIRRVSGTGTISFTTSNNVLIDITSQVSSAWQYVSVADFNILASGANGYFILQLAASGDSVEVAFPSAVLTSDAARPYQRVTTATDYADVGLPRNLTFDGVDDSLATAGNVDFATWTVGTRRNLLTVPTMFDAAAWTKTNATITANSDTAPDGTQTADTMAATAANATIRQDPAVAGQITNSIWIRRKTGTGTIQILDPLGSWVTVAVTSSWARFETTQTAATALFGVRVTTSGDEIYVWGAQAEVGSTATAFQDVGTDKVTLFSGVTKLSDAALGMMTELTTGGVAGSFYVLAPNGAASPAYQWRSSGTILVNVDSPATYAAPITNVLTGIGNIGGDVATIRLNGTQAATSSADQGTGNYASALLYIGRRGGTTLPFNGRLFQLVIRGAATDSVTVGNAERWVGQLTGVNL